MREMKDSSVEWIGEIPYDWKVVPLISLADEDKYAMVDGPFGSDLKNEEYVDCGIPIVQLTNIRPLYHNTTILKYVTEEKANELRRHNAKAGDLVIAKMMPAGRACILSEDYEKYVVCADVIKVSISDGYVKRFVAYSLNSYGTVAADLLSSGSTRVRISLEIAKKMRIAIPVNKYIQKMVDYLDSKCAKIDSIIEKQQAIIEKLKEYKLSVITEAVTKGLNPDVEMKDSGVEWIGSIPKHWTISKLKYLFGNGDDGLKIGPFGSAMKGKTIETGPYKIYNQAHLIQNDFSLNRHFVSEETFEELIGYEVKPDDILFSMMGTIGKCQIMPNGYPKGIMDSHLLKARLNDKILPEFFVYAYDKDYSNQVIQQLLYISNGTIMNGLNSTILKNVVIALPPVEEQNEIVGYLLEFVDEVDSRIIKVTKIVEKLQEYKKSLIYEVVTGKKEV